MTNILLVDDDSLVLDALQIAMTEAGFEVRTARDGAEALKQVAACRPVAVVTDIIMPGIEGIETILELKAQFPQVRVVAMSGGGRQSATGYLETAATLGADGVISKPFSSSELIALLARLGVVPAPEKP